MTKVGEGVKQYTTFALVNTPLKQVTIEWFEKQSLILKERIDSFVIPRRQSHKHNSMKSQNYSRSVECNSLGWVVVLFGE